MLHRSHNRYHWIAIFLLSLVTWSSILYPVQSVYAQDTDELPLLDDADLPWEEFAGPLIEKPEESVAPREELEAKQKFSYSLFLPSAGTSVSAQTAGTDAAWQTVHYQTFESTFPPTNGLWSVSDYNGPSVGVKLSQYATLVWDDNSTRAYQGSWSANPNDGAWAPQPGASPTYANHTDTWMRYGPFSLVGATNARFSFVYWLDSEAHYDYFTWEVSCDNNAGGTFWYYGEQRSGALKRWISVSTLITACAGRSVNYLRFNFKSDYSNSSSSAPTGVWVDNIRIEKFQ